MLEVGMLVAGKLRIERILGSGGMGVVAVATHVQLDQRVAIKVLHDRLADNAELVARFVREARAAAKLKSEHVCRVSDVGQLDTGAPYMVMELLEGQDLARAIAAAPLPVATAVDYVLQACIALAEAHARGIVHRDLKPANLFVTRRLDGTPLVKVLDFGIAKAPSGVDTALTKTDAVLGTPAYMSPEQLRSSREVDARADLWALGVILYQAVSGRLPFPGGSLTELAVQIAMDPPAPLDAAPAFREIVLRCLEKEPAQRYRDVAALAAALAPLGGPTAAALAALVARLLAAGLGAADTLPAGLAETQPSGVSRAREATVPTTLQAAAGASTPLPAAPPRRRWMWAGGALALAALGGAGVLALGHRGSAGVRAAQAGPLDARAAVAAIPPEPAAAAPAPEAPLDAAPEHIGPIEVATATHPRATPPPQHAAAEMTFDQALAAAREAWANGQYREQLHDLQLALAARPHDIDVLEAMVLCECQLHDRDAAQRYLAELPRDRAHQARALCSTAGMTLPDPAAASAPAAAPPGAAPIDDAKVAAAIAAQHCDQAHDLLRASHRDATGALAEQLKACDQARTQAEAHPDEPSSEPVLLAWAQDLEQRGFHDAARGRLDNFYYRRAMHACQRHTPDLARAAYAKITLAKWKTMAQQVCHASHVELP